MNLSTRTYQRFSAILTSMADNQPKSARELAACIHVGETSIRTILDAMLDKEFLEKRRVAGSSRTVEFVKLVDRLPDSIHAIVGTEIFSPVKVVEEKPYGARVISFSSQDMQDKLTQQDRLARLERPRPKQHIGSVWGIV